jgi:hypothetical protein
MYIAKLVTQPSDDGIYADYNIVVITKKALINILLSTVCVIGSC